MRTSVLFAALALAGPAAAASGAPVIHEPFTALPCPKKPATTLELEGCAQKALLRTDRQIDARARTIFRRLKAGPPRTAFVRGERSWLAYRRSSCRAESSRYAGGSLEPVVYLRCETRRNRVHLGELAATSRSLAQP